MGREDTNIHYLLLGKNASEVDNINHVKYYREDE